MVAKRGGLPLPFKQGNRCDLSRFAAISHDAFDFWAFLAAAAWWAVANRPRR